MSYLGRCIGTVVPDLEDPSRSIKSIDRAVRHAVLDSFLETSRAPVVEEIMRRCVLSRKSVDEALERLERGHQVQLVPGTHRILMAFPFSGVATPFRVTVDGKRQYFANCAWDSVAFHVMLRKPVRVDSFCHACDEPLVLELRGGKVDSVSEDLPVIYLGLPPSRWWDNIIHTCSDTMVFFHSRAEAEGWSARRTEATGEIVALSTMLALSEPIYAAKLDPDYTRPSQEAIRDTYAKLGLTNRFWTS
jgi:hypothetical protein